MDKINARAIALAQKMIEAFVGLILGKKTKIIWGQHASCDAHGNINLPRPKTGSHDEVALLTRMALHEAGHHEQTDWTALDGMTPSVLGVFNGIEDPRMEGEQMRKFLGAGVILSRGLKTMLASIGEQMDQAASDDPRVLLMSVLTRGYLAVAPHQEIRDFAPEFLQKCDQKLGERVVQAIERGVQQIPQCKSTHAMASLASAMWDEICQAHEEQQEDQQPEQEQSQESDTQYAQNEPGQSESQSEPDEQSGESGKGDEGESQSTSESDDGSSTNEPQGSKAQQDESGPAQADSKDSQESQSGDSSESPDSSSSAAQDEGQSAQSSTSASGGSPSADGCEADGEPSGVSEPGPAQAGQGNSAGATKQKAKPLDLSQAADQDIGSLMKQAYEKAFGEPDVDSQAPGESSSADTNSLSDAEMQAIAKSFEEGAAADLDYEQVVQCASQAIEETEKAELDKQQAEQSMQVSASPGEAGGHGAGSDSAGPGTPMVLDLDARLTGLVSRLVRVFLAGLQDKRRRPMRYAVAGGQVAPNRVWRLKALGDTKVFRVRKPMAGIDAAVTILLDRSGSMDEVIVEAASAALACAQALERVSKVKTSIEMFPAEVWGQSTQVLQRFGESARQVASRCALVNASGGTPLAQALATCVPRLVMQRAEKHMLIVITDGNPDHAQSAKHELSLAQTQGVEVVGIGMGSYCQIQNLIPNCTNIASVHHLPEAIENLLQGHIATRLAA